MAEKSKFNRREFLKVLGATTTVAAAGCAEELPEKLIGYVVQPDELIPGLATWYSGNCSGCSAGCGVLVRTREGRAVKVEGNPAHPVNRGKLCALGQSEIQAHYDPDRVREPLSRKVDSAFSPTNWKDAIAKISEAMTGLTVGQEAVLVTPPLSGSLRALVKDLGAQGIRFNHFEYDLFGSDVLDLAAEATFGEGVTTHFNFSKADVVVSFGADFLETWLSPVEFSAQWAERRRPETTDKLSYFVHFEPRLSLTAGNADRWVQNAPETEVYLLAALLRRVGGKAPFLLTFDERPALARAGVEAAVLDAIAARLKKAKSSLVVAGGGATRGAYAFECAVIANLINDALGNVGRSVLLRQAPKAVNRFEKLTQFAKSVANNEKKVGLCVVSGVNLAYLFPANAHVRDMLSKSDTVVHINTQMDETSSFAHHVLPLSTNFESWVDSEPAPGVLNLNQPSMQPLYQSQSLGDTLLALAIAAGKTFGTKDAPVASFYDYIRSQWRARLGDNFEAQWSECVQRGGIWTDVPTPSPRRASAPGQMVLPETIAAQRTLYAFPTVTSFDGRGANRPWMQELPAPITTAVWGSWVELHPDTASELGASKGDVIQVVTVSGSIAAPVYITPHAHRDLVAVPIGQGHDSYGRYAAGVGVNVLQVLDSSPTAGGFRFLTPLQNKTSLRVTFAADKLVQTQEYDFQGERRGIIRSVGYSAFLAKKGHHVGDARLPESGFEDHGPAQKNSAQKNGHGPAHHGADSHDVNRSPGASAHHDPLALGPQEEPGQMYRQMKHPLYRWGMTVDLASCTGCSACVVACSAENNVPVVGKDLVSRGREMSWIRIERYFDGPAEQPVVGFLPMFCQHCNNAPCEPVCPVYATYHNEDGLNTMVYNRCVGTRYCLNNCSYKVRRFNWFRYKWPEPLTWQLNPDVTVREVGIMEKCSFCIQRIAEARNHAKNEGRPIRDGEVITACAATCPTSAITFGNLLDEQSEVSKKSNEWRSYKVLDQYINTQPAVSYLARVRNDGDA